MKWRMAENSLFAILLRSPWWISFLVAGGIFVLVRFAMPAAWTLPLAYALVVPLPFFVIGVLAAWRQLRAPSTARVAETLAAVRAMSWTEFSAALEAAYRRDGYAVVRLGGGGADLELSKAGRTTLVGCKRWKAARTGVEPLHELQALRQARDAHDAVYVATGEVSDNARAFAAQKNIRLAVGPELAALLPVPRRPAAQAS